MRMGFHDHAPAYNVQTAVDAEHALIVAQKVTTEGNDQRCLLPMAEAAKQAVGAPETLNVVADAVTPTASKSSVVSNKASCRMCPPTAPSTTRAMARCSIAASSTMTRRPTPSAARPGRRWCASSSPAKIAA